MGDLISALGDLVGAAHVTAGADASEDLTHDEALTATWVTPAAVVHPASTEEVAAVVALARDQGVAVTARGAGTGMSGACIPQPDGILIAFDRMADIVEIDLDNHVAVVQPGVTLAQLDERTAEVGMVYPVFPGENSASLGGNVATNAGGMRAVRYGVTRHQVLGLTAVLGTGEVIRTGGRFVKGSSGYDLTQLIIGSEGTLALATEATLRLHPRLTHGATVLVPFPGLDEVAAAVPRIGALGGAMAACGAVGAVLLAWPEPLYAHGGGTPGLGVLADQRAAGGVMMAVDMTAMMAALYALIPDWAGAAARQTGADG